MFVNIKNIPFIKKISHFLKIISQIYLPNTKSLEFLQGRTPMLRQRYLQEHSCLTYDKRRQGVTQFPLYLFCILTKRDSSSTGTGTGISRLIPCPAGRPSGSGTGTGFLSAFRSSGPSGGRWAYHRTPSRSPSGPCGQSPLEERIPNNQSLQSSLTNYLNPGSVCRLNKSR